MEKKEEQEEEKKRIEEENKPANKFYSEISQGFVWESQNIDIAPQRSNEIVLLYFYPNNATSGTVSVIVGPNDYHSFFAGCSTRASYILSGNSLSFRADFIDDRTWSRNFNITIENRAGNIVLVNKIIYPYPNNIEKNQVFIMRSKPYDDPLKR